MALGFKKTVIREIRTSNITTQLKKYGATFLYPLLYNIEDGET